MNILTGPAGALFPMIFAGLAAAGIVFVVLFFVSAPYGRYARAGWGPTIRSSLGWLIMESPAALVFAFFFLTGPGPRTTALWIFFGLWEAHYIHRAFLYPWTIREGNKRMPVSVMLMAFAFNYGNAYVNGHYLAAHSDGYPAGWLADPRFITGVALFVIGYITNRWADIKLRSLRKPGELGYKIPYGGLFNWVSCPNYLGEIAEWTGWALATWSLPGLAFAVWTFANLAPRARANHAWYHKEFPEYPKERKALIPGVW